MTIRSVINPELTRRGLLASAGGLAVCVTLGGAGAFAATGGDGPVELSAWIEIAPDGAVRVYSPSAEMGQGSLTGLAAILAEELDADWQRVAVEFAPSDVETYGYDHRGSKSMAIVGSRAVMKYFDQLRRAGAEVRKALVNRAAAEWGVDPSTLSTEPHEVVDTANGRRMGYGDIVALGGFPDTLPEISDADLKARSAYRIVGKLVPRVDIPAKVNGTAQFALDVKVPGMIYATTIHSPVQGREPASWNRADVEALPGVVATVKVPNGVAILTETWPQALEARWALEVDWAEGGSAGFNSERALDEDYAKVLDDAAAERKITEERGDAEAAFASAAEVRRSLYKSDLAYHAQMEPLNAVAAFDPATDSIEVWDGTQSPDRCQAGVAEALGLAPERVTVHQCYMGGGFGRRSLPDYTVEAALLSKEIGRPVKLIWTREEDVAHGMFRPQNLQCLEAALDPSGNVFAFRQCVVGDGGGLQTSGAALAVYDVPNMVEELRGVSHGIRLKHWRAVAHVANMFALESFIDELATEAGMSPIAFRLERMPANARTRAALEKLGEMIDAAGPLPEGRAIGVAASERSGSLGAGAMEVSLDRSTGRTRVHRVWMAVDGGLIVTPDAARANIESGVVYGLSSALKERATVTDGRVDQSNFHDYEVLRMSEAPESIEIAFIESDRAPSGIGEIGNPWTTAALANGLFALTGQRFRHMPLTPDRVLASLKG